MKEKIGIIDLEHYRRVQPIKNAVKWAKKKYIPYELLFKESIYNVDWSEFSAIYIPLTVDLAFLEYVPPEIPIILDFDGSKGEYLEHDHFLINRRFAFRRAFGGKIEYNPEFQVPYLQLPLTIPESIERDVIIFDIHVWLQMYSQCTFLSIMALMSAEYSRICTIANCKLKFYLTSFTPIKPYCDSLDVFTQGINSAKNHNVKLPLNPLKSFIDNLIPPIDSVADYHNLIGRARLFITDHVDLADQDLIYACSVGTPIYNVSRNPLNPSKKIDFTLIDSVNLIEPRFQSLLDNAINQSMCIDVGLKNIIKKEKVKPWDKEILESAFLKGWDLLWQWAVKGHIDTNVNDAVKKSTQWSPNYWI